MPLIGYKPPVDTVDLQGGSFEVKGLSLDDVSVLIQANLDDAENLFEVFNRSVGDGTNIDFKAVAGTLATYSPRFVSAAIALACTEEAEFNDRLSAAKTLPLPVQIDAIKKIGTLTFEEVGGVKKFLEDLMVLKGRLRIPATQPQQVADEAAKAD